MKTLLLTIATLALSPSIAIGQHLPANYMILSNGQVINLDHLAGKGIVATPNPTNALFNQLQATERAAFQAQQRLEDLQVRQQRLERDANNRRAFDGARDLVRQNRF